MTDTPCTTGRPSMALASRRRPPRVMPALLLAGALAACSSVPPVAPVLSAGTASIEAARAAGAQQLAPNEFDQARTKFERARMLAQQGKDREAVRLAEQADLDAQLARARADAERARRTAQEADAAVQALREELRRAPVVAPAMPSTTPR